MKLAFFLLLGFAAGWMVRAHRKWIDVPLGNTRIEVPLRCDARKWMNGVEVDCPSGASIYYTERLKQASPR
jgi:hypothetical protein